MSATQESISQLNAATQANSNDLIPATQGSIGPGTGTTRAVTVAQIVATVVDLNNVGRNYINNSLFNVAQRGMGPWVASGYTADRWILVDNFDVVDVAIGALTDANRASIGDESAVFSLTNTFTGNSGANAASYVEQRIEQISRLSGKTVTASFWADATAGTKVGLNIAQVFGTGGSPSTSVFANAIGTAIPLSGTWTRYSASFSVPSTAGKTFGTNGDDYTALRFNYSSGSAGNQVAGNIGVQSGTINIWGVQLEIGPAATQLEKPDPQQDLADCQRFFQIMTAANSVVGYAPGNGQQEYMSISLPVTMRATPTISANFSNGVNLTSGVSIFNPGPSSFQLFITAFAAGSFSAIYTIGNTISADL